MEEKRSGPRTRVLKAGTIAFGGAVIDCTVRNMSTSGALLEVASPLGIPLRFVLVIPSGSHFSIVPADLGVRTAHRGSLRSHGRRLPVQTKETSLERDGRQSRSRRFC